MNSEPRASASSCTGLVTRIVPPARSMISRLIESPSPVPTSAVFVVKNGVQMRTRSCSRMPEPVSRTAISTVRPSLRVVIVTA
jgi:hypothetical protein